MTIHLVYVKGDRISTPDAITNELASRLSTKYELKIYDWNENVSIQPSKGDILLGHPGVKRNTVFRKSFWKEGWAKRIVMQPFSHIMPKYLAITDLDSLVVNADHFLAICGKYWTDTMSSSITSHWEHKTTQLDLAVNQSNFPFIKSTFGEPGKRRFLYIGHTADWKGCDYLAALADANPDLHIGWIGHGKMLSDRIISHGRHNFSDASSLELVSQYDFLLTCGRSDANPTTILESASWGLIPVCTPQSGYYKEDWIINIPLDKVEEASGILERLNWVDESELLIYQSLARKALNDHYNWDRFANQVIDCIEARTIKSPDKLFSLETSLRNRRAFKKVKMKNAFQIPATRLVNKFNRIMDTINTR